MYFESLSETFLPYWFAKESRKVVWKERGECSRCLGDRLDVLTATLRKHKGLNEGQCLCKHCVQSASSLRGRVREGSTDQFVELPPEAIIGKSFAQVIVAVADVAERIVLPYATKEDLALALLVGSFMDLPEKPGGSLDPLDVLRIFHELPLGFSTGTSQPIWSARIERRHCGLSYSFQVEFK